LDLFWWAEETFLSGIFGGLFVELSSFILVLDLEWYNDGLPVFEGGVGGSGVDCGLNDRLGVGDFDLNDWLEGDFGLELNSSLIKYIYNKIK